MAVLSCTLARHPGQTTFDEFNRGRYQLRYLVTTDGPMSHRAIANAARITGPDPLPGWGSTYSYQGDSDTAAFARTFTVESVDESQTRYVIIVEYSPIDPEGGTDPSQFDTDPLLRPTVVWIDRESYTRVIEEDWQGNPLVNKCNRVYDVPLEMEDVRGVVVCEKNVASLSAVVGYMRSLRFAVNSSTWTNAFGVTGISMPARTVLARDVSSGPPMREGTTTYYHVVFRFVIAPQDQTWDVRILERGFQYFKKQGANFILDNDGNKKLFPLGGEAEPVNLAADGTKLPDGQPGVFTSWRIFREVDFNTIDL